MTVDQRVLQTIEKHHHVEGVLERSLDTDYVDPANIADGLDATIRLLPHGEFLVDAAIHTSAELITIDQKVALDCLGAAFRQLRTEHPELVVEVDTRQDIEDDPLDRSAIVTEEGLGEVLALFPDATILPPINHDNQQMGLAA